MKKILMGALFAFAFNAAAAEPKEEFVRTDGSSREDNGFWKLTGELKNTSSKWVSFKISVDYLDAAGKSLVSTGGYSDKDPGEHFYAEMDSVPPGGTTPYSHLRDVGKIKGQVGSAKLKVTTRAAKEAGQGEAANPKVDKGAGDSWTVTGDLKSTGKIACRNPQAIAVGLDKAGKVHEVAAIHAGDEALKSLEPGKTAPYKVLLKGQGLETVKVVVGCSEPL